MFSRGDRASLGRRRSRFDEHRRDHVVDLHEHHHELRDLERDELGTDDD
jgi:hypothetical protein